ncbi:rhoptry kinase family protein rop32, partial [Cystoisospora suis]
MSKTTDCFCPQRPAQKRMTQPHPSSGPLRSHSGDRGTASMYSNLRKHQLLFTRDLAALCSHSAAVCRGRSTQAETLRLVRPALCLAGNPLCLVETVSTCKAHWPGNHSAGRRKFHCSLPSPCRFVARPRAKLRNCPSAFFCQMSFVSVILVWWFILHLGSERNWNGVTAARLPRLAQAPDIRLEGSLAPDRNVPAQAVSLSESSRSPASPGAGKWPRETLWRRMLHGKWRPSRHRPPSGGHVRELENEVQETDEASLRLPAPRETLNVEELSTSSSSSLASDGSTAVDAGAAGGEDHPRWIDVNYPFFQAAVETIDLDTRRTVAQLLRQSPRTQLTLSLEDMQFTSSLDQYLPDPFIVEPYSKRGDFFFSFRREELLGIGGNAVIYKVREDTTGKELALKIFRVKSDRIGVRVPGGGAGKGVSPQLRRMGTRTARSLLAARKAFSKGGTPQELLVEDFITVPITPPGRVRGLPDVLTVAGGWVVFNAVGLLGVAETDLLHFVSRHQLTRSMRENLTREMVIGLAKVHAYGVAHRDVKPENMLIYSTGQLSFTDFDSALPFTTPEGVPTQIDCARRSPGGSDLYFAPEVAVCDTNR